jgi:MoxR-like ATPase
MLDPKALHLIPTGYENIFLKKIDPSKDEDMISVLVDLSRSMIGERLQYAIETAVLIMEALSGVQGYVSEVAGFSDNPYYPAKTYDERFTPRILKRATYELATKGMGGTNDLGAVQAAIGRMIDRGGKMDEVRIFGIGIGPGTEYVQQAYGFGRGIHVESPKDIPSKVARIVEREILRSFKQQKKLRLILVITDGGSGVGLEEGIKEIYRKIGQKGKSRSEMRSEGKDKKSKKEKKYFEEEKFHFPGLPDEDTPENLEKIWQAIGGKPWMKGPGGSRVPRNIFIPPTPANLKNLAIMLQALFNGSSPEDLSGRYNNLFLWGEAGVAKTKMVLFLARLANQPIRYVAVNEDTDKMELIERPFYGQEKEGETGWEPSELVSGMEEGGPENGGDWVIVDEINRARSGVLKELNNILQFRYRKVRDHKSPEGTRTVKANPRFRVVAMANPPKGHFKDINQLSGDFTSRFIEHTIDWLPPDEEKRVLRYEWPNEDPEKEKILDWLVNLATEIRKDYLSEMNTVERPVSTRSLMRIVRRLNAFPQDKDHLRELFFKSYYVDDQDEVIREFLAGKEVKEEKVPSLFDRLNIPKDKPRPPIKKSEIIEKGKTVKAKYWRVGDVEVRIKEGPHVEWPPEVEKEMKHFRETSKTLAYIEEILKDIVIGENIYLVGDAGTGKNTIAQYIAYKLNWPFEYHQYGEDMDSKDVLLMPHVKDKKTGYTESQLIVAMRNGSIYFADEATAARPGVLAVWNNPLQFRWIDLWNGERIPADTDFVFMAASNQPRPPYVIHEFSAELIERFSVHQIDYLPKEEEVEQLIPYGPNVPRIVIEKLVDAANNLRKKYRDPEAKDRLPRPIDRRTLAKSVSQMNAYLDNPVVSSSPSLVNIFHRSMLFHEGEYQKIIYEELGRQGLTQDKLAALLYENWLLEEFLEFYTSNPTRKVVLKDPKGKIVAQGFTSAEGSIWGTWDAEQIQEVLDVPRFQRYHELAASRKIIVRNKDINLEDIRFQIQLAEEARELTGTTKKVAQSKFAAFRAKIEESHTKRKLTPPLLFHLLRQNYADSGEGKEVKMIVAFVLNELVDKADLPTLRKLLDDKVLPEGSSAYQLVQAAIERVSRSEVRAEKDDVELLNMELGNHFYISRDDLVRSPSNEKDFYFQLEANDPVIELMKKAVEKKTGRSEIRDSVRILEDMIAVKAAIAEEVLQRIIREKNDFFEEAQSVLKQAFETGNLEMILQVNYERLIRQVIPEVYGESRLSLQLTNREKNEMEDILGHSLDTAAFEKIILQNDGEFAINQIPVPKGISREALEALLKDMQIVLDRHPNKVLVLVSSDPAKPGASERVLQSSKGRIFLFNSVQNYSQFLTDILRGEYSHLDRKLARQFMAKAQELYQQSGRSGNLLLRERIQASQITGDASIFEGFLRDIPRQFMDQDLNLNPADKLAAQISFSFAASGKENGEAIRRAVSDYLLVQPKDIDEKVLTLSLNPARLDAIVALVRAVAAYRRVASAA